MNKLWKIDPRYRKHDKEFRMEYTLFTKEERVPTSEGFAGVVAAYEKLVSALPADYQNFDYDVYHDTLNEEDICYCVEVSYWFRKSAEQIEKEREAARIAALTMQEKMREQRYNNYLKLKEEFEPVRGH